MIQEKNINTIKKYHYQAYKKLSSIPPAPAIKKETSKTGDTIPVLYIQGRKKPLASTINPKREAEKIIEKNNATGHIIITALGAAYHIEEALKKPTTEHISIIEHDKHITKALLAIRDISNILSNPAVSLLVEPTEEELIQHIHRTFNPALNTALSTITMPQATEKAKTKQQKTLKILAQLSLQIAQDASTQAAFAKAWHNNALRNLPYTANNLTIPKLPPTVTIAAAGPSLEKTLESLKKHPILSTDTALPYLNSIKTQPILAASMDCQYYSTYHISGLKLSYPLILDLSSPPAITKKAKKTTLMASSHPLHQYLAQQLNIPSYPAHTGNITAALTLLAATYGATTIHIAGADYAYPLLIPYQRSTYHWTYHLQRTSRTHNLQTALIASSIDNTSPKTRTTPLLSAYKNTLLSKLKEAGCTIENPSPGHYIITSNKKSIPKQSPPPTEEKIKTTLRTYIEAIKKLPPLTTAQDYHKLPQEEKKLWTTLLPLLIHTKKQHPQNDLETNSKITIQNATKIYTERS